MGLGLGPGELSGQVLSLGCGSYLPFGQPVTAFLLLHFLIFDMGIRA